MTGDTQSSIARENSLGIPIPRSGPPRLLQLLRRIISGMDRLRVQSSPDIIVEDIGGRQTLRLRAGVIQRALVAASYPFRLIDVSAGGELRVGLYTTASTGFVNGIRPTLGGASIALSTTYATITATKVFALKADRNYSAGTFACTVEQYASLSAVPSDAMTASSFTSYLPLGIATVASGGMTLADYSTWVDFAVENYGNVNCWLPAPRQ